MDASRSLHSTNEHNGTSRLLLYAVLVGSLLILSPAHAQQVGVEPQPGPYYVGEPVVVQVFARGFGANDRLVCRLQTQPPADVAAEGPHESRRTSSYMQIINGRVTRSETINYDFNFVFTAAQEGSFFIGPFVVERDGQSQVLEAIELTFKELSSDPDMQIEVSLPKQTLYVGQKVPVTIRWAFAGDLEEVRYAFSQLQIRSPLFDQFTFQDVPPASRTTLSIATTKGAVEIDAEVTQERRDAREFIVVTGKRTMLADTVGEFDSIPVTCRTKKVTRWTRGLFGDLRAGQTRPALSAGEPLRLSVRPLPLAGRPASFAGAVGSGFSLEADANRTVVRVGDPISLSLTLRGDGNLENASLPSLSADGGMELGQFQLPTEKPAGTVSGNEKQFKVSVRVKDESVDQVPPLAFSWFDPDEEKYLTVHSKPIALQVMPAQVVSARDVISAPSTDQRTTSSQDQGDTSSSSPLVSDRVFLPQGANLAIERDATKLLTSEASTGVARAVIVFPYVVGVVFLCAAIAMRSRGNVDPEVTRRKKRLGEIRAQIAAAAGKSPAEAAEQVAQALRDLLVMTDPMDRSQATKLISECETVVYAPNNTQSQHAADELVPRALRVLEDVAQA